MKLKVVTFLLFNVVISICQQVRGDGYHYKFLFKLNRKLRLQSVKEKLIQSLFHEATSQGKAKGQNPNCPDLSNTKKLYRVIRSDENCQTGLIAKDPNADSTVLYHIRYGSKNVKTQFISTTTSLDIANNKYWPKVQPGGGLVEINVNSLPRNCKIVNLNDADTREEELGTNDFAFNFARKDCEVLLDCGNSRVRCTVIKTKEKKNLKRKNSEQKSGPVKKKSKKKSGRTRG